ncbi:MAG TPA: PIG-L family deacetylase [Chloroflexia bacterium]
MPEQQQYTIMTVHAHPDDEVVFTGGTLALYRQRGARTVLVTATSGEEGEIHDPDLDAEEARPRLGEIRKRELQKAVELLEISDFEPLGYRDSGMDGTDPNQHPDSFNMADREEATARLVSLVRKYKPHVLITYDDFGAYGHPDHKACNVITLAAFDKAGDPSYRPDLGEPWQPLKLYYCAWAEENWKRAREMYIERGMKWPWDPEEQEQKKDDDPEHQSTEEGVIEQQVEQEKAEEEGKPPKYVPPPITTRIDVTGVFPQKRAAILVHRTQFDPNGLFTNMPEDIGVVAWGEEVYSLVRSHVTAPEQEDDLLAGLS